MTETCCLDCLANCYKTNCRDEGKVSNGKYSGWCIGSEEDKNSCQGACVYFVGKEE